MSVRSTTGTLAGIAAITVVAVMTVSAIDRFPPRTESNGHYPTAELIANWRPPDSPANISYEISGLQGNSPNETSEYHLTMPYRGGTIIFEVNPSQNSIWISCEIRIAGERVRYLEEDDPEFVTEDGCFLVYEP